MMVWYVINCQLIMLSNFKYCLKDIIKTWFFNGGLFDTGRLAA